MEFVPIYITLIIALVIVVIFLMMAPREEGTIHLKMPFNPTAPSTPPDESEDSEDDPCDINYILYATNGNQGGEIFTTSIQGTSTQLVGEFEERGMSGLACRSDGTLWGSTGGGEPYIATVNRNTGLETPLSPTDLFWGITGITWIGDTLYGCYNDFDEEEFYLITLNPMTGQVMDEYEMGVIDEYIITDIAYDAQNDILYGTLIGEETLLITIDPSSGDYVEVGEIGFEIVTALTIDPCTGTLYAGIGNETDDSGLMLTLSKQTGQGIIVGDLGIGGISALEFCPE